MSSSNSCNIFLIGYPGAGKTTLGKLVAEKTGLNFFDGSVELMHRQKMNSSDIKYVYGQSGYGDLIRKIILDTVNSTRGNVITVPLTAILDPAFCGLIRETGTVFYLFVPQSVIEQRKTDRKQVPLMKKCYFVLRRLRSHLYSLWLKQTVKGKGKSEYEERKTVRKLRNLVEHESELLFRQVASHTIDNAELNLEQAADRIIKMANAGRKC